MRKLDSTVWVMGKGSDLRRNSLTSGSDNNQKILVIFLCWLQHHRQCISTAAPNGLLGYADESDLGAIACHERRHHGQCDSNGHQWQQYRRQSLFQYQRWKWPNRYTARHQFVIIRAWQSRSKCLELRLFQQRRWIQSFGGRCVTGKNHVAPIACIYQILKFKRKKNELKTNEWNL